MTPKNKIEVLIGGKIYTLVGNETQEYMQNLALYINKKIEQVSRKDSSKRLDTNMTAILTSLNVADELFKKHAICTELEDELEEKERLLLEKEKEILLYQNELGQVQQENIELKEALQNAQLETLKHKMELEAFIETFEEEPKAEG
ncbi:MAG: cell division protein ZapA [Epulopiscium sp.]|nr:cell division protein ZapA [Candidatus Epulonipiscium sp.]